MTDHFASTLSIVIGAAGIGVLGAVWLRNRRQNVTARSRTIWSLGAWSILTLVGVAIWVISRQMTK